MISGFGSASQVAQRYAHRPVATLTAIDPGPPKRDDAGGATRAGSSAASETDRPATAGPARAYNALPPLDPPMDDADLSAFARSLADQLAAAGVDTSADLKLSVGSDGHVRAADGTPDKDRIDAFFADHPEVENQFRLASSSLSLKATFMTYQRYVDAYSAARTNEEREDVWRNQMAIQNRISSLSSTLTLSGGAFQSDAVDFVAGLAGTASALA